MKSKMIILKAGQITIYFKDDEFWNPVNSRINRIFSRVNDQ